MKLPATIKPEQVTAIIDTREKLPLDVSPLKSVRMPLVTGDYSVLGLEKWVTIERKSLPDLVQCVGRDRRRFEAQMQRLLSFPVRALIVEARWNEIELGRYHGQVAPNAVIGSLLGWLVASVPVLLVDDHVTAGRFVSRILFTAARRRWQEMRPLVQDVLTDDSP